jgi:hypothetical protein
MRDNGDGTTDGKFRLPTLHAELLKKALETLTSPRNHGENRLDPETGKPLPTHTLHGHGLMSLLENHLDLTSMPSRGGSPFTVVITLDFEALKSGLGVATVETGCRISAGEARRLACRAGIIPMVLGGDSVPLDLGRERRLFTKHQKIALDHQHHGCAAETCDTPPAWVEYHHQQWWGRDHGNTDLNKGVPYCTGHHRMAHQPHIWHTQQLPNGKTRFTRRA